MLGKRYLVPRGDGLTLVGSTEEPEAGFREGEHPAGIEELLRFARQRYRCWRRALETAWSGAAPRVADGLPFIGPGPGTGNVYVATGHFRAGVQLSIGTAQAVTIC
jgi:glycine oxidase